VASILAFIGISPLQLLIVAAVILLLFGHRLPGTMRSLGQGINEFKRGLREADDEEEPKLEDQSVGSKT
jgi:sec-independent protein translocase protein TatA